jgi:hypothetical protein
MVEDDCGRSALLQQPGERTAHTYGYSTDCPFDNRLYRYYVPIIKPPPAELRVYSLKQI